MIIKNKRRKKRTKIRGSWKRVTKISRVSYINVASSVGGSGKGGWSYAPRWRDLFFFTISRRSSFVSFPPPVLSLSFSTSLSNRGGNADKTMIDLKEKKKTRSLTWEGNKKKDFFFSVGFSGYRFTVPCYFTIFFLFAFWVYVSEWKFRV